MCLTFMIKNTPVKLIGQPNSYLKRPGFWHGAAGVAACWYGAAVRLANFLQESCQANPNPYKKLYLCRLTLVESNWLLNY